jgi:hypothetical protein
VLAGAVAATTLLAAVLAWRLLTGPISLGPITSYIQDSLNDALVSFDVQVEDAVILWSQSDRSIQLRFLGVRLDDREGGLRANVPEMEMGFSTSALLRGVVAPTRVTLIGPSATLVRKADGSIAIGLSESAEATGEREQDALSSIVAALTSPYDANLADSYLEEFLIDGASLTLFDQASKSYWHAPNSLLGFRRHSGGIAGRLSANIEAGKDIWRVDVTGHFDDQLQALSLEAQFADVMLSSLAENSAEFAIFREWHVPVQVMASMTIESSGQLQRAEFWLNGGQGIVGGVGAKGSIPFDGGQAVASFDVESGRIHLERVALQAGGNVLEVDGFIDLELNDQNRLASASFDFNTEKLNIDLPGVFSKPGKIDHLGVRGKFAPAINLFEIESADMRIEDAVVHLSGRIIDEGEASPTVDIFGSIDDLPVSELSSIWPIHLANGAHDWVVENLSGGVLKNGRFKLDAAAGELAQNPIPDQAINFQFDFSGLAARYIAGLPKIKNANGSAQLTGNTFRLDMEEGWIGALRLMDGEFVVGDLDAKPTAGRIEAAMLGQTSELLRILDHEPLGYPSRYGLDAATVEGQTQMTLAVSLPLIRALTFDQVELRALADVQDAVVPNLVNGETLRRGNIVFKVDNDGLNAVGDVEIAASPMKIDWSEDFRVGVADPTVFKLSAQLDGPATKSLGFDLSDYLGGTGQFDLVIRGSGQSVSTADLHCDLSESPVTIAELDWVKEEGELFQCAAKIDRAKRGGMTIKGISFEGDDVEIRGAAAMDRKGGVVRADFKKFKLGDRTDAAISFKTAKDGSTRLALSGESFALGGVIADLMNSEGASDEQSKPRARTIDVDLSSVFLSDGIEVSDVLAHYSQSKQRLEEASFSGKFVEGGDIHLLLMESGDSKHQLRLTTPDAGRLIRGLGLSNAFVGGSLDLAADLSWRDELVSDPPVLESEDASGAAVRSQAKGKLTIEGFEIVGAPVLARLLTLGSLSGTRDMLQGDGIHFDTLKAPFSFVGGKLSLQDVRASGPSLGLTASGGFSQETDQLRLNGTIVPSYTINNFFGKLPILGSLLISREGEGVIAFTYGVKGTLDEPKISVNPLSGLAPGFLRRIFQSGANRADSKDEGTATQ